MRQNLHNHAGRWAAVALVAIGFQSLVSAQDEAGDEASKDASVRTSTASSSATTSPGFGEAGSALAITRRDNEDGSSIVQVIEDDKMIRIAQRPGKGITVIVVETVRDSEKVNRYSAPNVNVLKARHPRGYEIYQRYAKSDSMVAEAAADTNGATSQKEWERAQDARHQAQLQQMRQQMQQMQQMIRQQQAQAQQRARVQQAGTGFSRGAWGFGSARASASGHASSSARASGQSSSSSSGK